MKRLLLVDDDRVILNLLAEGLRELGYPVSIAASGEAALELLARETFDLAVLDIRMPGISGLDIARILREAGGPPFVFLSAFGDGELVAEAAGLGALGYLVKPVDLPQLVPFIEASMARGNEIAVLRNTTQHLEQALAIERRTRTAVGIIMERRGLDRDEAFELLRASARARRLKVGEVADEVIGAVEDINDRLRPIL